MRPYPDARLEMKNDKKQDIRDLMENELFKYCYNDLCDIETILLNRDIFLGLKNIIQKINRMD